MTINLDLYEDDNITIKTSISKPRAGLYSKLHKEQFNTNKYGARLIATPELRVTLKKNWNILKKNKEFIEKMLDLIIKFEQSMINIFGSVSLVFGREFLTIKDVYIEFLKIKENNLQKWLVVEDGYNCYDSEIIHGSDLSSLKNILELMDTVNEIHVSKREALKQFLNKKKKL